jgi:hypothetical protein
MMPSTTASGSGDFGTCKSENSGYKDSGFIMRNPMSCYQDSLGKYLCFQAFQTGQVVSFGEFVHWRGFYNELVMMVQNRCVL